MTSSQLEIVPFAREHIPAAAALFSASYQAQLVQTPLLPARYADPSTLEPLLDRLAQSGIGVAALERGEPLGFLAAWRLPNFRGSPAVFSPEWGNGVVPGGRWVCESMYTHLAAAWRAQGILTHLVSLLPSDREAIECWQWLGFGMVAADAVRDLQPAPGGAPDVEYRQAGPPDLDAVVDLVGGLCRHLAASPTFLPWQRPDRGAYEDWLRDPARAVWLACRGDRAVAFVRVGPASDKACTIIRDAGTASITGAYTREGARGGGVATGLLNRALEWARERGYVRCAVDFEPMNHWARRFWLGHFHPVCYSWMRQVGVEAAAQ